MYTVQEQYLREIIVNQHVPYLPIYEIIQCGISRKFSWRWLEIIFSTQSRGEWEKKANKKLKLIKVIKNNNNNNYFNNLTKAYFGDVSTA